MTLELSVYYQILCQVPSQKKAETPCSGGGGGGVSSTRNWDKKEKNNNDENNRELTAKKEWS